MIDLHTHTNVSVDSEALPDEMILKAKERGITLYAITDHVELNRWFSEAHYDNPYNDYDSYNNGETFERAMQSATLMKEKYSDIKILCGVELGQATSNLGLADEIIKDKRLDFVIASIHQLKNREDFAFIDYKKFSDKELQDLLNEYFNEIYTLCKWGGFDTLGHLTYTLRYIEGESKRKTDLSPFRDTIAESFREVIKHQKAIEINTSGLRQKYGKTFPDIDLLKLYKDLGGKVVTIGSDAHRPEDVGTGLTEGVTIAEALGFKIAIK
ncbi:MAG: histidinol-phosphatase HisJ family protein [Ruminococcus sp.]|jgi:histidinol-phosphatase (PHP family)|nr:histidinol-phosphatase HisJ family protein [Ruminococcus sp.]